MSDQQQTIARSLTLSGRGLHTGLPVNMTLKPAEISAGIVFVRTDLPGQPRIKLGIEAIQAVERTPRCTTISAHGAKVQTVEHVLSALSGLGIDNMVIELDAVELPGLDGSAQEFFSAIQKAGLVKQDAPREWIEVKEPLSVYSQGASITIFPDEQFKVSYLLDYPNSVLKTQYFSATITKDFFEKEIAPCRTFCLQEEAEELRRHGLGLGATYENSLVFGPQGVIQNTLRFPDECVRHKILDLIGDLYLLGKPIRGNVMATKSGHRLNLDILKAVYRQKEHYQKSSFVVDAGCGQKTQLDIQEIMRILPHRYPFLFVDRIICLEKGKRAVGIKNVTMNDNFFPGHFPTRPIMPGVLMVEALAQTGGILVLTNGDHHGKVALFMAVDKVKFRKLVEPGEQLELDVEVLRDRAKTAHLKGTARVNGEVAVEAEMLFSYIDASFLEQK